MYRKIFGGHSSPDLKSDWSDTSFDLAVTDMCNYFRNLYTCTGCRTLYHTSYSVVYPRNPPGAPNSTDRDIRAVCEHCQRARQAKKDKDKNKRPQPQNRGSRGSGGVPMTR